MLSLDVEKILDYVNYVINCRSYLLNGSLIISVWGRDMVVNLRDSHQLIATFINLTLEIIEFYLIHIILDSRVQKKCKNDERLSRVAAGSRKTAYIRIVMCSHKAACMST